MNLLTIVFSLFLTFSLIYAETPKEKNLNSVAVKNLETCLKSENEGVRKSAIYFAGLYKVKEVMVPLMKILRTEGNEEERLLAAQSLFKLNNDRAAYILKSVSVDDNSEKVRNHCSMLYYSYVNNKLNSDLFISLY